MSKNQMSTFHEILKICFPEDWEDNNGNFQPILQEEKYANPTSLVSIIFKLILTENLKNETMHKKVEDFVKENALPLSHLHYLSNYPILFEAGLITILQKLDSALGIEIRRTSCSLKTSGKTIIEFPNGEDWKMPIHFANLAISSSIAWFCLSVTEPQNETETRKESLDRILGIIQQNARLSGICHIGCYEQRPFDFPGRKLVILFQKRQPHTCKAASPRSPGVAQNAMN